MGTALTKAARRIAAASAVVIGLAGLPIVSAAAAAAPAPKAAVAPVRPAASTAVAGTGLLRVATTVLGAPSFGVCEVEITVGTLHHQAGPACGTSGPGPAADPATGVLALAEPVGTVTVSVAPHPAGISFSVVFGGSCSITGAAKVSVATSATCTVTVYAIPAKTIVIGKGVRSRLVSVTDKIVGAPGASPTGLATLLCADTFRVGQRTGATLTPVGPVVHPCAQTANPSAATSVLSNAVYSFPASPAPGISDSFSHTGFITTFSAGCTALTAAVAKFASAVPLVCTITHTATNNTVTGTRNGLLDVATTVIGAPSFGVCKVRITIGIGHWLAGPACSPTGLGPVSDPPTGTLALAEPAGARTVTVTPVTSAITFTAVLGGACSATGTVLVVLNTPRTCTVKIYATPAKPIVIGKGGRPRLISVTDKIVGATGSSPTGLATVLCTDAFRVGIRSGSALASPGPAVHACAQTANPTAVTTVVSNAAYSFAPSAVAAISDSFSHAGFITTFSAGCTALTAALAKFAAATPVTCTITHTATTNTGTGTRNGLLQVITTIPGAPPYGVCEALVTVSSITGHRPASPVCAPGPGPISDPATGTLSFAITAGAHTVSVAPRTSSISFAVVFSGACSATGAVTVSIATVAVCRVSLPDTPAKPITVNLNGKARLVEVTDTIVGPPTAAATSALLATLLCSDTFRVGAINGSTLSPAAPAVAACAQTANPTTVTTVHSNALYGFATNAHPGISDLLAVNALVTTYSAGCIALAGTVAGLTAAVPLTCTITHTAVENPSAGAAATVTSIKCPDTAGVDGTTTCAVTVAAASDTAASSGGVPTGTVFVAPVGVSCTLANGGCKITVSTGTTENVSLGLTAEYLGAAAWKSSSNSTKLAIRPRTTDVALDCSSAGLTDGNAVADVAITCSVVVTDAVDPADYTPDGTVSVDDGNNDALQQQCSLDASTRSCAIVFGAGLPAGSFTITATYSGDATEFATSQGTDPMTVVAVCQRTACGR